LVKTFLGRNLKGEFRKEGEIDGAAAAAATATAAKHEGY
jgi:hypothetical protein